MEEICSCIGKWKSRVLLYAKFLWHLASTKYNLTKQLQCHWSSLWTLPVNKGSDLRVLHDFEVYESRPSCPAFLCSSVWWCFERKSWTSWCRSCAVCWRWKCGMQLSEKYPVRSTIQARFLQERTTWEWRMWSLKGVGIGLNFYGSPPQCETGNPSNFVCLYSCK